MAAVARVFEPGYKFDSVVVLGGAQGIGKSTFIRALAGGGRWYGELSSFDNKIAAEEMQGRWLMEINELGATNKHDLEQQKAFLSAQSTTVRMAYARNPTELKRQCVFFASTNETEYLKDSTGNRRWWPIDCGLVAGEVVDLERLAGELDQIWAEAYSAYLLGEPTTLGSVARGQLAQVHSEHTVSDDWEGIITAWLDSDASASRYDVADFGGELGPRDRVCVVEVWQDCLKMAGTPPQYHARRIATALNNAAGWIKAPNPIKFGDRFGRQKGWIFEPF